MVERVVSAGAKSEAHAFTNRDGFEQRRIDVEIPCLSEPVARQITEAVLRRQRCELRCCEASLIDISARRPDAGIQQRRERCAAHGRRQSS